MTFALRSRVFVAALILLLSSILPAPAQNPDLAPDDLKSTEALITKSRFIANVELQTGEQEFDRYRYERTGDVERITRADKTYIGSQKKKWVQESDSGKKTPVESEFAEQLSFYASVVRLPFDKPQSHDSKQGGFVWKLVHRLISS